MADGIEIPPIRWLFGRPEQRRPALQYWVRDTAQGFLSTAIHEGLKALPIDACSALGAVMGKIASLRYPASDARARRAWCALRPEQSDPAALDAAMHRLWAGIGRTMAEFSVLNRLWPAGRIAVEGLEHMEAARAANRSILGLWLHLGNWEVIGLTCLATGYPGTSISTRRPNRFDDRLAVRARKRYGGKMIWTGPGAMRSAARVLKKTKGGVAIFVDGADEGPVAAPAFGRTLRTDNIVAFVARLARITNATIIPAYCLRIGGRAHFKVTFCPEIELVRDGDDDAALLTNVSRINTVIEPIVLAHLDQWISLVGLSLDA
jgi:KDO2-lipid IV(A) lauroyltransferase